MLRRYLILGLGLVSLPGLLFPINFNAPRAYSFGNNYSGSSLAIGDFNGDGLPDIAAAAGEYAIDIFLSNSDGGMRYFATYSLGSLTSSASGLVAKDFNRDGKLDLAVVTNSGVSILLGQGDGTFASPVAYATGGTPYSVASGDFNRDGIPDLAVANSTTNNVSILLGKGDGTFLTAVNYTVGTYPEYLAVGDFNGDGKPDLAVTNYAYGTAQGTVSILFGAGDGTFGRAVNHPTGKGPQSIAVGDFNGDGKPDLAITLFEGKVSILLAGGGGTFLAPVFLDAGPNPGAVTVLDVNQDGKLDVAVANQYEGIASQAAGGYTVSILHGNGDGTFRAPVTWYVASATTVGFGDFNGDGNLDLACAGYNLSILPGTGKGGFEQPVHQATGTNPMSVATGDFNGDGKPDLAVANYGSNNISILLGKGDGSFYPQVTYDAGLMDPSLIVVGDFNGDGKLDLAVAGKNGISLLPGNGDGTFGATSTVSIIPAFSLVAADINLDGKLDLVTDSYVALGYGNGRFAPPLYFPGGGFNFSSVVGDFNGDGKPDLAVQVLTDEGYYSSYITQILLGIGNGTFNEGAVTCGNSYPAVVGDFNGDGKLDLAAGYWIAFGNGDGTFGACTGLPFFNVLGVGDFNGDGKPDLITGWSGAVSADLGNGDGTFQNAIYFVTTATSPNSAAVADFNGDGKLDLAVVGGATNTVTILTNTMQ